MPKLTRLAALLLSASLISAPVLAADAGKGGGKPVATVNGQPISSHVYDAFAAEQKAQGAPDSPELQAAVKEELVRREILAQEAKKKGLDKNPNIQGQIELAKQAVLIRAFLSEHVKANPISEAQLKAEYDVIKNNLGSTEYKSRHILVEKEEDAKAIIAKLDKGEKFSELAKQFKDPGSKDNGGELGWSSPKSYVKPFADALQELKKGEVTKEPVKTEFGYHVIQLEDTRPLSPPPFEQVRAAVERGAALAPAAVVAGADQGLAGPAGAVPAAPSQARPAALAAGHPLPGPPATSPATPASTSLPVFPFLGPCSAGRRG